MLLQICANLLELPLSKEQLIRDEFNHKYLNTYMEINGDLYLLVNTEGEWFHCFDRNHLSIPINSKDVGFIKPFLPETGLYIVGKNLIFLSRTSRKQWRKSFNSDMYSAYTLANTAINWNTLPFDLFGAKAKHFAVVDNQVLFEEVNIGTYNELYNRYTPHPLFEQEIKELTA